MSVDGKIVERNVSEALREDVGPSDLSAPLLAGRSDCTATVLSRGSSVLCGRPWFDACFRLVDPAADIRVEWLAEEGAEIGPDDRVCVVSGPPAPMLSAERTALNFLQTLSGTAALARRFAEAGAGALVVDTRKTLPGLRHAQKYAVRVGGAANQRLGLHDGILVKENHAWAAGGLEPVLRAVADGDLLPVTQVEVRTADELRDAIRLGATRILLDNFTPEGVREAVAAARATPGIELEASGGVTLDNIAQYARTGVDRISVGAITKDVRAADFSMRVDRDGQ